MARILFVQPSLQPPGGGNGVAAWMLQALLEAGHAVTLLTWWPYEPTAIDAFYGTQLAGRPLAEVRTAPAALRLLDRAPARLDLLRNALFMQLSQRIEAPFEIVVSANNEWPSRRPAVTYIHFPARSRPRPKADLHRWFHRTLLLDAYYAVADTIGGYTPTRASHHRILVNSDWTGDWFRRVHPLQTSTLYPPVVGPFIERPWAERDDTVITVGRFSPEKRLLEAIALMARVRASHPVRMLIIGSGGPSPYRHAVEAEAAKHSWVRVLDNLPRPALLEHMSRCKWGLHTMHEEHFGMAPAELVEAGCVTWVHASGGQQEIVAHPDLAYPTDDALVTSMARALSEPSYAEALRAHLAARQGQLGPQVFCARLMAQVEAALNR